MAIGILVILSLWRAVGAIFFFAALKTNKSCKIQEDDESSIKDLEKR